MRQANANAGNPLQRFLLPLAIDAAKYLRLKRSGLLEQIDKPRFELIGDEFLRWPDVQHRDRPVIQPFADDIQKRFRLAALRSRDQYDAPIFRIPAELFSERDGVWR